MTIQLSDQALLKTQAYIDGQWQDADSGETVAVSNPATGEVIAEVAKCSTAETRRAIEAANAAFPEWRKRTAKERSACLRKWFNLMMAAQEDLALIMTLEQGKPLAESRGEIAYGANYIEWFAEEGKRMYGDTIPQPSNDKRIVCIKQPVGVVACITPWNFPHADAQDCAGAGRRLHRGVQARQRNAAVSLCFRRTGGTRRNPTRSNQHGHRRNRSDRQGADL